MKRSHCCLITSLSGLSDCTLKASGCAEGGLSRHTALRHSGDHDCPRSSTGRPRQPAHCRAHSRGCSFHWYPLNSRGVGSSRCCASLRLPAFHSCKRKELWIKATCKNHRLQPSRGFSRSHIQPLLPSWQQMQMLEASVRETLI